MKVIKYHLYELSYIPKEGKRYTIIIECSKNSNTNLEGKNIFIAFNGKFGIGYWFNDVNEQLSSNVNYDLSKNYEYIIKHMGLKYDYPEYYI